MTNFEIYAYWNTTELVNVFNAVAAITGGGDFMGLLRTIALVMVIGLALAAIAGKARQEDFWRWVFLFAIMHGLLLVPKSNVVIVDRTGSNPTQVVSNVPIGLAALAHSTSKIGDWLTTAFETTFSQPEDVQLRKTGTLFGHRVMLERIGTEFASPILMRNLDEFYRECVLPDIATGYIDANEIAQTDNIWQLFSSVNPGLLVTLHDYSTTGISSTYKCTDAYNILGNQMNLETNKLWDRKAQSMFPNLPLLTAKAAFSGAMTSTPTFFAPTASLTPVADQLKQGALCNYIIDAPARVASQMGDTAQVQQAHAQASSIRAYKGNTATAYNLSMSTMPKFRNAVEMMLYAVFPIIVVIVIVAGTSAGTVLKGYIGGLLWVQLWAPLYAILNYMMNLKTAQSVGSTVAAAGDAYYSCGISSWLGATAVNDMDVASYFAISIPVIAWMLVQGSMSAMGGMIASASSGASSTGAGELQGTMRRDQMILGEGRAAPTITTGAEQRQHRGPSGAIVSTNLSGQRTIDAASSADKTPYDAQIGQRVAAGASRQSEAALTAAGSETVAATTTIGASTQRAIDFVKRNARETGNDAKWGIDNSSEVASAAERATKIQDSYLENKGYSEKMSAAINATASAIAATPGLLEAVSPVRLKAELATQLGSSTDAAIAFNAAKELAKTQGYSQAVRTVAKATESKMFSDAENGATGSSNSIQALTNEGRQHLDEARAQLQKSMAYKELANEAREGSAAFSQSINTRVMDRLATEPITIDGHTHNGLGREDVHRLMMANNPEMRAAYNRIANEEANAFMQQHVRDANLKTRDDVKGFYEEQKGEIATPAAVTAQGERWKGEPAALAANAGVTPTGSVGDTGGLKGSVAAQRQSAGDHIIAQTNTINGEGGQTKATVDAKHDKPPSFGGLLGNSAGNAAAGVLPSGTVWLAEKALDKLGMDHVDLTPNGSFWKKDADGYGDKFRDEKGDIQYGQAITGAAIETGLMFASPLAGKALGPVAGKLLHPGAPAKAAANVVKEAGAAGQAFPGLTGVVAREAAEEVAVAATRSGRVAATIATTLGTEQLIDASNIGGSAGANIDGAVGHGQQVAGDTLDALPGKSNVGRLLSGGQRPAPAPAQPSSTGAPSNKDDTPGPGGR